MKIVFNNMIFYAILYSILFFSVNSILSHYNTQFMNWFYYLNYSVIIFGFIIGLLQIVLKQKNKTKKYVLLISTTIFICILVCILIYIFKIAYTRDYIVEKNGKTMVANIQSFHSTYINYYEYINQLMKSKSVIISEYYSNGSTNPFETDTNYINILK